MNEVARLPVSTTMRGQVTAIIPQSIEDVFRVAKGVVQSGLAPDALTKGRDADQAAMAVAVAIMSGAELGLKPMVALRSFTVINGKPALYGDGLINVVRQSGKAAYLRTGCDTRDGKLVGWCEAKRSDTDEDKRVEFSQDDAIKAGLWQTSGSTPWAKYPQRMLAWRAAGWCLRELFGDVLGGIRDEYEAADSEPIHEIAPPPPAVAPPPPEEAIDVEADEAFDVAAYMTNLFAELETAKTPELVTEAWDAADVERRLSGMDDRLADAFTMKQQRLEKLTA